MNAILKNILAVIAGILVGSIVNMGLIMLGLTVISPPAGVDMMDAESLKSNIHLFEFRHFISPFLAHALGTLAGAYVAARIAVTHQMKFALGIGVCFFLGGVMMVMDMPSPMWFNVLDLVGAYVPMAWIGWKLSSN
ncbi:MAG: hypothetical protein ABJF11_02790 [Reichenbachiella sp.]|uniref:hypothetical protein n=1 Tax=Reichenbachiella sp. TaxID=2184521 RepID=UPI0032656623